MVRTSSDTLMCRFKYLGLIGCKLDSEDNLIYVDSIVSSKVVLPYGLNGLLGVGLSGLPIKTLKFNKELTRFEPTALSNLTELKEIIIYKHQLSLVEDLHYMYPDLIVSIHKEMN